jgi:alpha-L-fucosidase
MEILRPTPTQLLWQQQEFGLFCHFGINTFYGKEWSDGTLDPKGFAPTALDPAQWVDIAQQAGAKYLILTAKHHDGFCLWPTATTEYSVSSSGFEGDVVALTAAACERAGMKFGLYLSPWDRNAACYADKDAYDDFYARQLDELCTRYGELFELWFDGAGSEGRVYDWDRFMSIVERRQPQALIFNMGRPTVRWVGNEDGLAPESVRYVVESVEKSAFTDEGEAVGAPKYLPPECDVAIRQNWFWQPDDAHTLKSTEHLLGIWYRSVWRGANLLLNVPPDRRGLLDDRDSARLLEATRELKKRIATPLASTLRREGSAWILDFGTPQPCDHLMLQEPIEQGQRVFGFRVLDDAGRQVLAGHTIGHKTVLPFAPARTKYLRVELTDSLPCAAISGAGAFETSFDSLPGLGATLDYGAWAAKADRPPA